MGLDDLPGNRQPKTRATSQPHTRLVNLIESLKDPGQILRWDTWAIVGDRTGHQVIIVRRLDQDGSPTRGISGMLEGVVHKIDENLPQAISVTDDRRQRWWQIEP